MRKFATTIVAVVIFAGLLAWTLTKERGRVPDKEEVFRGEIARADDLTKIEIVKYERTLASAAESTNKENAPGGAEEASNDEGQPPESPVSANAEAKSAAPREVVKTTRVVLEKRDDDWYALEPFQGLVDPDTAKAMVKAIVELKPGVRKDADVTAKEFALDKPTLEVTGYLKGGRQVKITLGADTPMGAKVFAKISDKEGLFLVPASFKTDMDKKPETLRDKKLARFDRDKVVRVTFTNQKGTVVAQKQGDSKTKSTWRIISPGEYKADEWAITSGINKVTDSEAKEFAPNPNDLKAYGLDRPRAQIKVELKDGKVFEVVVGNQIRKKVKVSEYSTTEEEKDLVYAMRLGRPEVLLVESTLFDDLNKDLFALRDKHILDLKRDDVLSFKVERAKGLSFSVMRTGDTWTLQTPEAAKANKNKVDDILWDLTDLQAKEYVEGQLDMKQIGLAVPSTVITLRLRGGKTVTVKFGDEVKAGSDTLYYCQTSDSQQVYKVGDLVMKDLPQKVEDIKEGATGSSPASSNFIPPPTTSSTK